MRRQRGSLSLDARGPFEGGGEEGEGGKTVCVWSEEEDGKGGGAVRRQRGSAPGRRGPCVCAFLGGGGGAKTVDTGGRHGEKDWGGLGGA